VQVDVISPTLGRPDKHEGLYRSFDQQTLKDKRLFVLDESIEPSEFFGRLRDRRVRYVHKPNSKLSGVGQGGIGRARNELVRMTRAPIIAHADDDDWYHPEYLQTMIGALGQDQLVKLSVWNALLEDGSVWQWDTRQLGGQHFAIEAGMVESVEVSAKDADSRMVDWMLWGYGFSFVYRRHLWEMCEFPEQGTEDYPWVKSLRGMGARLRHFASGAHLCLHLVHDRSPSAIFPQRRIAGLAWQELAESKSLRLKPGMTYRVLAMLKDKHQMKQLASRCATWGLQLLEARDQVSPGDYGTSEPPKGYRLVLLIGKTLRSSDVPWRMPAPLSVLDKSEIVRAWTGS
jgi:hypothetical protein